MISTTNAIAAEAPLEDLMVAMDVVDTVRHRQLIVDRELNADTRRERLLQRLREIYAAQGIEVTEAALESGVDALEEERFRYEPRESGSGVRLAKFYVRRDKWLRPVSLITAFFLLVWLAWYFMVALPERHLQDELPNKIEATHKLIMQQASSDVARGLANEYYGQANRALRNDDYSQAQEFHAKMQSMKSRMEAKYDIRVIARPNELSGVWRVPSVNAAARNYYLIVEAVSRSGQKIAVPIKNEEDGKTRSVTTWGVRVGKRTFDAIAADKRDDGIIQSNVIGHKDVGRIEPDYAIETSGATITEW